MLSSDSGKRWEMGRDVTSRQPHMVLFFGGGVGGGGLLVQLHSPNSHISYMTREPYNHWI